jgi:hypothetical protein
LWSFWEGFIIIIIVVVMNYALLVNSNENTGGWFIQKILSRVHHRHPDVYSLIYVAAERKKNEIEDNFVSYQRF